MANPRVLIIDDSCFTLATHSAMVEMLGLEPITAEGGEPAIYIFEKCRPEIVLCDIMMPEMDGFETCEALKKIEPALFFYFISAEMTAGAQAKARSLGAAGFFQKPVNIKNIKDILDNYLARRHVLDLHPR